MRLFRPIRTGAVVAQSNVDANREAAEKSGVPDKDPGLCRLVALLA